MRDYRQNCALAHALDLVGERWTLLVIRELLLGPRRFRDLEANLPGIGTNLLSRRLQTLSKAGIIERDSDGFAPYRLTPLGRELKPAIDGLIRWGLQLDLPARDDYVDRPEWDALALSALLEDPAAPDAPLGQFELHLDEHPFSIRVSASGTTVSPGTTEDTLATIYSSTESLKHIRREGLSMGKAEKHGWVRLAGDREKARGLLKAFQIVES